MTSIKLLRARPHTSARALDALKNDALWPDLLPRTGRGKPVPMSVQDGHRSAQNDRIAAVKQSIALAQFDGVQA